MASQFGKRFGAGEWARLAGLWHDLGKFHPDFQQMLADVGDGLPKRRVDHSSAGAIHADAVLASSLKHLKHPVLARLPLIVTAAVAGHHGGLPSEITALRDRLRAKGPLYSDVRRQRIPHDILRPIEKVPSLPARLVAPSTVPETPHPDERLLWLDFLIRMVFSALVDADRLDAERVTTTAAWHERSSVELRGP